MNHYEILGVNKTASPDEIKRAYRSRAKQVHPDKGGKQSDFEPVVRAYEVLSDPERRQLYDSTGKDRQPPIDAAVQQVLLNLFNQALAAEADVPLVETVRNAVKEGKRKFAESIKTLKDRKKKLTARRKTVKSTGGENIVHMIVDRELDSIAQQIASAERDIKIGDAALKALKKYSEDWEEPTQTFRVMYVDYGGGSGTTGY